MDNKEKLIKCINKRYKEILPVIKEVVEEYYNKTHCKVKLDSELLCAIFLSKHSDYHVRDFENSSDLASLASYLDFQEMEYENLVIDDRALKFMKNYGMPLRVGNVIGEFWSNELSGVYVIGSFDQVCVFGVNFSGHLGSVIIDPQKIWHKNLGNTTLAGVTFNGAFDEVSIVGADFTESKNAVIDPQKICYKDLSNTILTDAMICGSLDGAKLINTSFKGSKGAVIDLCTNFSAWSEFTDFTDVTIVDDMKNITKSIELKGNGDEIVGIDKVIEARNQIFSGLLQDEIKKKVRKKPEEGNS